MIVGLCIISWWRLGRVVFSDVAFHVMMCMFWFVIWVLCVVCGGLLGSCGGCEYSFMGSLYFSVSLSRFSGRYGNLLVSVFRFMLCLFSSI